MESERAAYTAAWRCCQYDCAIKGEHFVPARVNPCALPVNSRPCVFARAALLFLDPLLA